MRRLTALLLLLALLSMPVSAELAAPAVPEAGRKLMPEQTQDFSQALGEILQELMPRLMPRLYEGLATAGAITAVCLLTSLAGAGGGQKTADLVGAVSVGTLLMRSAGAMIRLGEQTVTELSEYSKLLLPAMTAALAAQGGGTAAAALYVGSAAFNAVLSRLLVTLLIPVQYLFLGASVAGAALESDVLKNLRTR